MAKKQIKKGTTVRNNTKSITQEEVMERLAKPAKKLVAGTIHRYANGPLSSVFNESEVQALAQDTALEVCRRVMLWVKNKRTKGAVDPRGCEAYFSRAFINQCQKIYEKYAKTDIRAGVQTVSSDEALAVAASRNLETPEHDWILQGEIRRLLVEMEKIDHRVNDLVTNQAVKEGRNPRPEELQYSKIILEKTLLGYEPNEIRKEINLSEVDYARHRRAALELAKERIGFGFNDYVEHFNGKEDYRIYTKEVKKRKRSPTRNRNYTVNPNFYIQTSMNQEKQTAITSLYVRIDILEDEQITKEVKPKLIKLEEHESNINKANEVRDALWSKTKSVDYINNVKNMGQKYLKSVKKTA
jgi:hypothetical protein